MSAREEGLTLTVEPAVAGRLPGLTVGAMAVAGLEHAGAALDGAALAARWDEAAQVLGAAGITLENLAETEAVDGWRRATAASGLKPSKYRSSVEALARRLLRAGAPATPLPVVDLYCALSVRFLVPLGAYDADRLPSGRVVLRPGRPASDRFEPLGGAPDEYPLRESITVYADGDAVLCWNVNHRDSAATSLIPSTRRAVFFGEALTAEGRSRLEAVLAALGAELSSRGSAVSPPVFASAVAPRLAVTVPET
jgi:DNA/RNA-binding domain of Phe-tRNA-synthetase-like protein